MADAIHRQQSLEPFKHDIEICDLVIAWIYHLATDLRNYANKSFRTQTVERGHDRLAARSGIAHKILDRQPLAKIILRANHSANEKIVNFILLVHSNCLQLWRCYARREYPP